MTSREEIREGIAEWLWENRAGETTVQDCVYTWAELPGYRKDDFRASADKLLTYEHSQGVVIKVDRELPVVCELEPDVDACFGQEVCCEILPKYIKDAGSVSSECYREIIGLAYALADTIAKTQRDFNAEAGHVAVEPLIEEK